MEFQNIDAMQSKEISNTRVKCARDVYRSGTSSFRLLLRLILPLKASTRTTRSYFDYPLPTYYCQHFLFILKYIVS